MFKCISKNITTSNLKILEKESGNKIYNNFLEILRHNCVSDKPNAFNKMMNLFLCKITDEQEERDVETQFQVKYNEDDKDLLIRLNNLYNSGMRQFLGIKILDFDSSEIENLLNSIINEKSKQSAKEQIEYLRIKKTQEFNFIDIYDDKDFRFNTNILKEIITILQEYRLRYTQKHQFLGDFFEKLLNDSLKQESGQFFTPIPLCRFIISSIPLENIIKNKISSGENNFLPYSIDFACGTGHFLTELMEEVQNIINNNISEIELNRTQKDNLRSYKIGYNNWAKEYVYGIDKDKRLVKASKIACFLNGDRDANLIASDGLGSFKNSEEYVGKLKVNSKDNENFDLLISNPPYSVKAFKNYVIDGKNSFDLFNNFTDNSDEIEVLFVERMKQLLKIGGKVGIILPTSLLTNSGLHEKAREIILQNFRIVAMLDMGNNAFMATGTKTTIFFLEKIKSTSAIILNYIEQFFNTKQDITINGIEKVFSKYSNTIYNINIDEYLRIIDYNPIETTRNIDIFKEYEKLFFNNWERVKNKKIDKIEFMKEKIREIEKQKLLYFILTYSQSIVIGKSKEKDEEKAFYGYEFSNRKGQQGIKVYRDSENRIISKLYNEIDKYDNTKLSSYILRNFDSCNLKEEIDHINEENSNHSLKGHIDFVNLWQLMNFENCTFDKSLNLNNIRKNVDVINSKWGLVRLGEIANVEKGKSLTEKIAKQSIGNIPVIAGGTKSPYNYYKSNYDCNTITVSASGSAGYVWYHDYPIWASDCSIITINNSYTLKYIYYFLKKNQNLIYSLARGISQPHVYPDDLKNLQLPLPPIEIQQNVVEELDKIEKEIERRKQRVSELNNEIKKLFDERNFEVREYIFENVINRINGIKIKKSDFKKEGNTPIISQDIEFINGYIDVDYKDRITDVPAIIFGDHNCVFKYVDFNFVRGADGTVVFNGKENIISTKYLYYLCKCLDIPDNKVYKRHFSQYLSKMKILIPSLEIQKQIVDKIEKIEEEIKQNENETELENMKKEVFKKYDLN